MKYLSIKREVFDEYNIYNWFYKKTAQAFFELLKNKKVNTVLD